MRFIMTGENTGVYLNTEMIMSFRIHGAEIRGFRVNAYMLEDATEPVGPNHEKIEDAKEYLDLLVKEINSSEYERFLGL